MRFSRKKKVIIGLILGVVIIIAILLIWAWKAGKLGFLAIGENQILNTANVTYQNSQGETVSVDSNPVLVEIVGAPPTGTVTINLQLQGRTTNFAENATFQIFPVDSGTPVYENTNLALDASGTTQISLDLPDVIYNVRLKPDHYLAVKLLNVPLANFGNLNFGTLTAGDLLVDNQINGGDFTYLKQKFRISDPVDPVADIDQSGEVNTLDFSVIYTNWGLNGQ